MKLHWNFNTKEMHWKNTEYHTENTQRQKGLTDNFLKMELSPVSCLESWYLPIKNIKQLDLGF